TTAPTVDVHINPQPAYLGQPVTFLVLATDDVGVQALSLTVGGTSLPLDALGQATWVPPQAGDVTVVATATDAAGNIATTTVTLSVLDPSDVQPPTAIISTPAAGALITAPTDVVGTAADETGLRLWRLEAETVDSSASDVSTNLRTWLLAESANPA